MSHPNDIDLSENLKSTFGCVEFEFAACVIVNWLKSEVKTKIVNSYGWWNLDGTGWEKIFCIEDIPISSSMFAMMAAAGWICNYWFPKGSFCVSKEFVKRLEEKWLKLPSSV